MKETLIILTEPIFKFNKQFFDDFDVDFHIYTNGDDSFYDLKSEYKNIIFIVFDIFHNFFIWLVFWWTSNSQFKRKLN